MITEWKWFFVVVICIVFPSAVVEGGAASRRTPKFRRDEVANDNAVRSDGAGGHGHGSTSLDLLDSFAVDSLIDDFKPCEDYHNLNTSEAKCDFIRSNPDCSNNDGFFNYLEAIYCGFPSLRWLGLVILALWLLYLLVALGVTAEEFFCPDLNVMSRTLKMSQNIAGVTLLAFGNGAPDIFSAIAAITSARDGNAGLAIGALFGAGIFVTTVVAGSIAVTRPFKMVERPFLRDSIFYLIAVFWTFYILYDGKIRLLEAVGYIILYVVYVCIVFVGRKIYQTLKKRRQKKEALEAETSERMNGNTSQLCSHFVDDLSNNPITQAPQHSRPTHSINSTNVPSINSHHGDVVTIDNSINGPLGNRVDHHHHHHHLAATRALAAATLLGVDEDVVRSISPQLEPASPNGVIRDLNSFVCDLADTSPLLGVDDDADLPPGQVKEFLMGICPLDTEEWSSKSWFSKAFEIIKIPLMFLLQATIPVVDYSEPKHKWNRLLNVLNLLIAPTFCAFVTHALTKPITGNFYVWHLIVPLSVLLAAIVFFTSRHESQPVYHWVFSYIGFVVAVLWIYTTANEIVNILQMFGIEFRIDDAILGLTVLAWGNSIGDLVADVTMAKQGFPTMGMSACFGGPMFNMLLGIGISCLIVTIQYEGEFELKSNNVMYILAIGLAVSLLSSMFIMLFTGFHATRWYGIYLFILYFVFLLVAILVEVEVIPW